MTRWRTCVVVVVLAATVAVVKGQGTGDTPLFTAEQAAQGKALYLAKCSACHGEIGLFAAIHIM